MSAVLALYNRSGKAIDPGIVEAMLRASTHRGVNGQQIYINGSIALAHQHFWITPEEIGEIQPLIDNESGCVLTADVRLDSRQQLANKLGIKNLNDTSDAKLLLRAYQKWGTACAEHLLGDFAFIVWDGRARHLYMARDPLGVRDLCFHADDNWFIAASEPKQIPAHPAVERRINEGRVADYLVDNWSDHWETFFEHIYYLAPGYCVVVTEKAVNKWRYWDFDPTKTIVHKDERDYYLEFHDLLRAVVRDHLRVDGQVGVSLSGGPDSATLAALIAAERLEAPLKSYSYVFDRHPDCDEREYILPVVKELGLDATLIPGDEDWPLKDIATWPVFEDFASQDPYVRLPLAVMDAARGDGCKVVFNGHFSDVLMAGGSYWAIELLAELRVRDFIRLFHLSRSKKIALSQIARCVSSRLIPDRLKRALGHRFSQQIIPLVERLHPNFVARTKLEDRIRCGGEEVAGVSNTKSLQFRHLTYSITAQGFSAFRSLSNGRQIEVIDPFWDRRLIEYVLAVPAYLLGRPPYAKWLLRQAVKGRLPEKVIFRADKTTLEPFFKAALSSWERETVAQLLEHPRVVRDGIVRQDWIRDQLKVPGKRLAPGHALWQVICLELWLQRYWST